MVEGKGRPNDDVRSRSETHAEFLKLCALATAGSLREEEQRKLREHLVDCPSCLEAMKQFETVVDHAIPTLAPDLMNELHQEDSAFSADTAVASFLKRLSEEDKQSRSHLLGDGGAWLSPPVIWQSDKRRQGFEQCYFWLPMAAVVLLCLSLGMVAYRTGLHRGVEVGELEQNTPQATSGEFQQTLEAASRERDAANTQLADRNKAISELQREIARQRSENAGLTASQSEKQLALRKRAEEQQKLTDESGGRAQQAATDKEALEAKLKDLERQRSEDVIRVASLEGQVAELSSSFEEQKRSKAEDDELLAKDRDIRELMGARDLYVAEVHDLSRADKTEKAFGRVFYTKGKSLIFYAYDLNEPPGLKGATKFQAWGRRGADSTQAFKLGMLYEDNLSKKRWILKFNDKKTLDQIDAVFVTVEPQGGSDRPTGKPLLFADLKVAANQP